MNTQHKNISSFISFTGLCVYERVANFIEKNNILDEFFNVVDDDKKLFSFAMKYGILEIIRFLYENKNYTFDYNELVNYNCCIDNRTNVNNEIEQPVLTHLTGNDSLRFEHIDKFSHARMKCICHLLSLKYKSIMYSKNGKFYYKLNPKHLKNTIVYAI